MHMSLSKRTHIMLDPAMFSWLQQKATKEKQTVGSLVRLLLKLAYQTDVEKVKNDRLAWWQSIKKLRDQHSFKGKIDYKELTNDGRKYLFD